MCVNYAVFIRRLRHLRRRSTKCPRDKMAGDEVFQRRNGWRRSVPATKWLATNCTRDETAGDELSLRRNDRRRNGGDERGCTLRLTNHHRQINSSTKAIKKPPPSTVETPPSLTFTSSSKTYLHKAILFNSQTKHPHDQS